MSEKGQTRGSRSMHVTILAVLGIILFIVGIAISTIHGTGLRGSGLGTLAIVAGLVLLFIAYLRYRSKRA
jgi:hypothetical protein